MRSRTALTSGTAAIVALLGLVVAIGADAQDTTAVATLRCAIALPRGTTDPGFWRPVDTGYVDPDFWRAVDTGYVDPGFAPGHLAPAGGVCSVPEIAVPVASPTGAPIESVSPSMP